MAAGVTGLEEVTAGINKQIAGIKGRSREGLILAGNFVKAEAQDLAPVDTGTLMGSAFTDTTVTGGRITTRVGFTAKYAAWVHEMPMTLKGQPRANFGRTRGRSLGTIVKSIGFGGGSGKGTYWSGGENKFLQKALSRNVTEIVDIIRQRVKLPGGGG